MIGRTESDFSKGSIISHMLRLAIPMTLAQLVNVLYNIIDRIFIGMIPEDATNALTGLGVAFPVCTLTIAFANLVGMGGAPLFSIERGRDNREEAGKILGNSFVLLLVFGVLLSVIVMFVKEPLLYLLGASKATFGYADSYLSIYLLGTVFVMLSLGLNAFINAQGFSGVGMMTVSIGAVCNVILDPVFIFGVKLGVQGAACATVLSQLAATLWTLRFLTGKKAEIRLMKNNFPLEKKRVKNILFLGTSGFTMSVTNSAVQMVCNSRLSVYGGDLYVAVMTVINSVREIVQLPVSGIGNGAQPIISFNYGAGEPRRVRETIRYGTIALLVYTLAAWGIVMLCAGGFIRIFSQDAEVLNAGIPALHIYFFGFFTMAFQFAGQTTFQALGKSKQAIFFSLLRKAFIVIPLTCLLPMLPGLGVWGVFLAEPVSNFIGGLACFLTMYLTVYRRLEEK